MHFLEAGIFSKQACDEGMTALFHVCIGDTGDPARPPGEPALVEMEGSRSVAPRPPGGGV